MRLDTVMQTQNIYSSVPFSALKGVKLESMAVGLLSRHIGKQLSKSPLKQKSIIHLTITLADCHCDETILSFVLPLAFFSWISSIA